MVYLLILVSVLLISCDSNTVDRDALTGSSWILTSVERAGETVEEIQVGDFGITFQEDGQMVGNDLCNQCFGEYEIIAGDRLRIDAGCTEIGCPRLGFYVHARFPYGPSSYALQNNQLRLQPEESDLVFVFQEVDE